MALHATTSPNMTNVTTASATSLANCDIYSETSTVFKIIAYVVITVFSLTGNTIILALFARGRQQRKLDPFIISIAASDLLVPFFAGIRELNTLILRSDIWLIQGTMGDVLCKIVCYFSDISPMISIMSMCCITMYQFIFLTFSITEPIRQNQPREKRVTYTVIALTWIIAIGFNSHYFHTYKIYFDGNDYRCDGPFFDNEATQQAYRVAICILLIFFPFALISILNTIVAFKVRKQLRRSIRSFPQWQRNVVKKQRRNQILVVIMILVFAVCWGPLGIAIWMYAFKLYQFHPNTCFYATFHFVSLFIAHSNAAINPWIYLFFFVFPHRCRQIGMVPLSTRPLTTLMASFRIRKKVGPSNTVESAT